MSVDVVGSVSNGTGRRRRARQRCGVPREAGGLRYAEVNPGQGHCRRLSGSALQSRAADRSASPGEAATSNRYVQIAPRAKEICSSYRLSYTTVSLLQQVGFSFEAGHQVVATNDFRPAPPPIRYCDLGAERKRCTGMGQS